MAEDTLLEAPEVAAPEVGGGDGQGPTLTDAQKKELHGIVTKMVIAKEPDDNIKLVIDHYTKKNGSIGGAPAAPAAPQQAAALSFPGSPDFSKPSSYLAAQPSDVYSKAVQGAAERMHNESQNVDPAIVSLLTRDEHQRRATDLQLQIQKKGDMVNSNPRLRQELERILPKPLPVEISPEAVQSMKQEATLNPTVFGEILREHARLNPDKAGQLKADMYLLNTQATPGNATKRLANAEEMKAGNLDYNLWHPAGVEKPEGFLPSIVTAHKERNQEIADYEYFQTHPDQDIIKKLNDDRAAFDPDEPKHVPSGFGGVLGSGLGGNAEIIAKGGAAATLSTMLGAPEVAPYFGAAMATPEMTARAFSGSLKSTYYQLLDQGLQPAEALKTAKNQATVDAAKAGAQGVLMTVAGARLGMRPSAGYTFTPQFKNIITGIAKETGKFGKEALATAVPNAAIAGGLEAGSNIIARQQGIKRDIDQNVFEAAGGQLAMELGLGATLKLGGKALKVVLNNIAKQPQGSVQTSLKDMESHGTITPEQGQSISDKVDEFRAVDEQIPAHIDNEDTRIKISDLIQHRDKLDGDLETLNKAYHPAIKQKIADIDEEIQKLSGLSVKEKPEGATPPPPKTEGDKKLTDMPEEIKTPNIQSDEINQSAAPASESGTGYAVIRNVKPKQTTTVDKPYLPDKIKTETVKPMDAILVKGVPLSDIKISDNVRSKVEANIKKGVKSGHANEPVVIKYNADGTLELMDGAHRLIEAEKRGDKNIDARVMNVEQDYETFKPKENAIQEPRTGGVLQHPQEGTGEPRSERERVEPSQQGEGSSETRGEESQAPGEEENVGNEGPPPVDMGDLPFTPGWEDVSGITHEAAERTRQQFGLGGEQYESQRKYDIDLNEQADRKIHEGYDVKGLIDKMANNEHHPSDLENTILKKYKGYLSAKLLEDPSDANLAEMRSLSKATDMAGTLQGRAFRSRQGFEINDNSLGSYFDQDMRAAGTETLTPEHKAQVIKEYESINETQKRYDEKIAQLEAENAKLKAAKEVKRASAGGRQRKSSSDYGKERSQIVDSIKEKLRKARGETNIVVVPYAKELIAIAPDVAKLVKSIASEGIDKLEDVITAVREQLKDVIPEITDKDIHNIIAGEYSDKKPFTELQTKLRDLRTQAQLVNKLESLERGEQPKTQKSRTARSREIEELREKIKDFEKANTESGKFYQEDVKKTPLEQLKEKVRKQIKELEGKIAAGDYSKPEKSEPIKLDHEAIDLQDQLIALKQEREKRLAQMEYDKKSTAYHVYRNAMELTNIPRTIMASADFSAPLRQGAVATVAHPIVASKAAIEMFKSAVSQKNFDRWLYDLKEKPIYRVMEKSGLYIADPNSLSLTAREEAFMSHVAEKIPIIGETLKIKGKTIVPGLNLIKGSERAYTAYLNKMRADLFTRAVDAFANEGKTVENSPELYKAMAKFINAATGRGELPGVMKSAAPALNSAFFSPRLIASRLQLLNPAYYIKMPPAVRKMALMDMAKFLIVGTSVVSLAHLSGADVETDGRSPDFGKIKVGNTRWDVWGGFQQYVRVADQLLRGQTKSSTTGNINSLTPTPGVDAFGNTTEKQPRKTRGDVAFAFFRGKLAPVPGTVLDYLYGKDVVGHKFDPRQRIMDLFTPMVFNDVSQAWKDQHYKALFTVGIPSAFGVGVQTYGEDKKSGLNDVK